MISARAGLHTITIEIGAGDICCLTDHRAAVRNLKAQRSRKTVNVSQFRRDQQKRKQDVSFG